MIINKSPDARDTVRDMYIAALIGLAAFLAVTGGCILNPFDPTFIFATGGDAVQHYVGWLFYRHAPLLQIPFGSNPAYGETMSSTVVFTDSIPLMAFLFRPLSRFLPLDFQYIGIWTALTFTLQAIFAWKLLARLTSDRVLIGLGTGFFVLCYPMILRIWVHEALSAQWLVLAALYVFLDDARKSFRWALLLCVASLVHAYLVAMVAAIWAADMLRRALIRECTFIDLAKEVVAVVIPLIAVMGLAGYFKHGSTTADGFGIYRMNLSSPFNRGGAISIMDIPTRHGGDYEGAVYLGAGMIALVGIAIFGAYKRRLKFQFECSKITTLALLSAGLLIYAISNRVAFGSHELFSYSLDRLVGPLARTFRVSGRFAWAVVYLLQMVVIGIIIHCFSRRTSILLLSFFLVVQACDVMSGTVLMRERWSGSWSNPIKAAFWNEAGLRYKRIAYVPAPSAPPGSLPDNVVPLDIFASSHGMSVTWADAARPDFEKAAIVESQLRQQVDTGQYRLDTLYVIGDDIIWARARDSAPGFLGSVDGYRVIAPGMQ